MFKVCVGGFLLFSDLLGSCAVLLERGSLSSWPGAIRSERAPSLFLCCACLDAMLVF